LATRTRVSPEISLAAVYGFPDPALVEGAGSGNAKQQTQGQSVEIAGETRVRVAQLSAQELWLMSGLYDFITAEPFLR
jgi:hypothetical protein